MRKLLVAALLMASSPALPAQAGDLDGITLTMGKFSIDEDGFARQTLSAKNGTSAPIEWLNFECGFLRANQLMATGVHYLLNLQAGQTGYQTVTVRITTHSDLPDHADCRMSLPAH
jgi:hypothetical protein